MKRLKSLYIKDFRSIDGEVNLSLDAPITLIHGPNGAGKTSLLSAIELALTGGVPSLSRADPDYLAFLPHKDRPFGEVRLDMSDASGDVRTGEIRVTAEGISGTHILQADDAEYFSERSYLAQATLGRLLEIYQHSERKAESPLTRFVKELLGLDRMEALIAGLHSAGNVTRLKAPVPAYSEVRDRITKQHDVRGSLLLREVELGSAITTLEGEIREKLSALDSALADSFGELTELARRLDDNPEEARLHELVRLRRELDVSESGWTQTSVTPGAEQRSSIELAGHTARSELEKWIDAHGAPLEALLDRAAAMFGDATMPSASSYSERAAILAQRVQIELTRVTAQLEAHQSAVELRTGIWRKLDEARTRLGRLDDQLSTSVAANETLAKALSDLSTHIQGETCPVCDRDFAETGQVSLAAHIASKVTAMVEEAGRLQSLSRDRTITYASTSQLERDYENAARSLLPDAELSASKSRLADLTDIETALTSNVRLMEQGDALRENATRAARSALSVQTADQSAVVLRSNLDDLARRVGFEGEKDMPIIDLINEIRTVLVAQENSLADRQQSRRDAVTLVSSLEKARGDLLKVKADLRETETDIRIMTTRKVQADRLIDVAKDIARQTREARGRVVRRVFNDELNTVWRDLFVRLAPEEPFIPAFAIPDAPGADIEAVLETHHRRGGKGGNPRAMLSAGNLNTAALTLFLSLHLSSKARLPWLVIDDPVQSMDEVHIAQFAALLRTLSKQMKRQVIVAVHERSLFDYLALELSPAFDGDRLNIIELGRSAIGKTTSRWEPRVFTVDRAIAA